MSNFTYTRALLAAWGRWSLWKGLGYPDRSIYVPRVRGRDMTPADVLQIDGIVCAMARDPDDRDHHAMLIAHYHRSREIPIGRALGLLGISRRTYYTALENAQWAAHSRLWSISDPKVHQPPHRRGRQLATVAKL